jgi:hypothetical protein
MIYLKMKTNKLLLPFLVSPSALYAQISEYYSDGVSGSSSGAVVVAGLIISCIFIFGGAVAKKNIFLVVAWALAAGAYMWLLMTLGKYLQQLIYPTKSGIGLIVLITFGVGWFGVMVWWSKNKK